MLSEEDIYKKIGSFDSNEGVLGKIYDTCSEHQYSKSNPKLIYSLANDEVSRFVLSQLRAARKNLSDQLMLESSKPGYIGEKLDKYLSANIDSSNKELIHHLK